MIKKIFPQKNINLISLIIYTASFKLAGYVVGFYLFVPFLFKRIIRLFNEIKSSDFVTKYISAYFLFLIINTLLGFHTLKDPRILIFWIPYFFNLSSCICVPYKKN